MKRETGNTKKYSIVFAGFAVLAFFAFSGLSAAQEKPAGNDSENGAESLPADPQSRIAWADTKRGEMENLRRRIQRMLDEARQEHDIIKVTCLNDKLTQTNANLASFESRLESFKNAVNIGDKAQQDHEFSLLVVRGQKADTLAAAANACVGEEAGYLGQTKVSVEISDNITATDPTREPSPGVDPTVDPRPPEASAKK